MQSNQDEQAPYWSRTGLWAGIGSTLPMLPGTAVFGMAFGTVAAQKGLTLIEAALMSALVFGGASQLVAMEIWTNPITWALVAPLALVTAVVNMRLLLMSASLRPWLGPLPAGQTYPALLLTTDATWLIAMRYRADGGSDASVLLGSGLALWLLWVPASALGYLLGALIAEPARYDIDLIMPIFFVAMLVPLWRGPRRAIPWVIAGAVALAVQHLVSGFWFIIAGALAGAVSGGFIDEPQ